MLSFGRFPHWKLYSTLQRWPDHYLTTLLNRPRVLLVLSSGPIPMDTIFFHQILPLWYWTRFCNVCTNPIHPSSTKTFYDISKFCLSRKINSISQKYSKSQFLSDLEKIHLFAYPSHTLAGRVYTVFTNARMLVEIYSRFGKFGENKATLIGCYANASTECRLKDEILYMT